MSKSMSIVSVQVGVVRQLGDPDSEDPAQRPWRTGFYKSPVDGPVRVWREGLIGDAQADRRYHGGPDKAVLAYAWPNYLAWRAEEPSLPLEVGGAFGENLTIDGPVETDVCIGDVYRIGDDAGDGGTTLEVTQPREPCSKLGRRFGRRDLPQRIIENGRGGWYLRVKETGHVAAGQPVRLIDRPYPALTIAVMNDMLYGRRPIDPAAIDCPALSKAWKRQLGAMLAGDER